MGRERQINLKCKTKVNGRPIVFYYLTIVSPIKKGQYTHVSIDQIAKDGTLLVHKDFRIALPFGHRKNRALAWFHRMRNIDSIIMEETNSYFEWDKHFNRIVIFEE